MTYSDPVMHVVQALYYSHFHRPHAMHIPEAYRLPFYLGNMAIAFTFRMTTAFFLSLETKKRRGL